MSDTLVHPCAIRRDSNHAGPDWMRITALWQRRQESASKYCNHWKPGLGVALKQCILHFAEFDETYSSPQEAAAHYNKPRHWFYRTGEGPRVLKTINGECWVELRKVEKKSKATT